MLPQLQFASSTVVCVRKPRGLLTPSPLMNAALSLGALAGSCRNIFLYCFSVALTARLNFVFCGLLFVAPLGRDLRRWAAWGLPATVRGCEIYCSHPDTLHGGLRLVPGVEWSGSATRQIQLAMIGSFETSEAGNALLPEHGVLAAYELASQIKHFRLEGETAICEMLVSLVGTRDRNLIAIADVDSRKQAVSSAASDRALALRDAASDCAASAAQFAIDALSVED